MSKATEEWCNNCHLLWEAAQKDVEAAHRRARIAEQRITEVRAESLREAAEVCVEEGERLAGPWDGWEEHQRAGRQAAQSCASLLLDMTKEQNKVKQRGYGKNKDNECEKCDGAGECYWIKCKTCGGSGKIINLRRTPDEWQELIEEAEDAQELYDYGLALVRELKKVLREK
jgi:DnaJ-class molecular chaperone